jgi:hypothetical protein
MTGRHKVNEALAKLLIAPQESLVEIIRDITDKKTRELMVTSQWTLHDAVAHLLSWALEFEREVRYCVQSGGGKIPWTISTSNNYAEWNETRIEELRDIDFSLLLGQFVSSNERLKNLLLSLPDETLNITAEIPWYYPPLLTIPEIISVKSFHEKSHIQKIIKMRDKNEK